VLGTGELLRLACMHGRPFHFVSSLSVCYSTIAPARVDEGFDALPHLGGVHLGYAQTKVVAEALVNEAGRRGLPVTIYRPSLISGHSVTGAFNGDDLLSLLVKGCVRMGCAPDLDWTLDAMPVDIAARHILRLSKLRGTFHLAHPRARHWRECVLWMRLYGYPLTLMPYHAWRRRLENDLEVAASRSERHPLQPLRRLLFERPDGARGLTIPELFEDTRRSHAVCHRTTGILGAQAQCPDLDAALLDRYFAAFVSSRHLPPPVTDSGAKVDASGTGQACHPDGPSPVFDAAFFSQALASSTSATVLRATALQRGSAESILSELTAWRSPRPTGLFRCTLDLDDGGNRVRREVMLKVKARDTDAIAVGEALSGLCDERIGAAYGRWKERLGMAKSHLRELAIYAQTDERFTRHTPALIGSVADEGSGLWALVLECVGDAVLFDASDRPERWSGTAIDAVVAGLSSLQSIWYGRGAALRDQPWIGWIQSGSSAAEMRDLWNALADHARPSFCGWSDPSLASIHRMLVARTAEWWRILESQPQTLIHNDFNPRNVCLKADASGLVLCAYDWELATLGAPQRDLAEFLCFVLTPAASDADIDHWIERHRTCLEAQTGERIEPALWRQGFAAALYDVLVSRLGMYCLIHRVRRQPFLPRVVQTWRRLYERFPLVPEA
jgi:hypothetical protein